MVTNVMTIWASRTFLLLNQTEHMMSKTKRPSMIIKKAFFYAKYQLWHFSVVQDRLCDYIMKDRGLG